MNINYIILAHKNPKQLGRLIKRLNYPEVYFYVHIDKKSSIKSFKDELPEIENLYLFEEDRINIIWGHLSQVKATLMAISKIIEDKRIGYCVLMSGQDYPLKSNEYIHAFLNNNYGKNFIDLFSMYSDKSWDDSFERIHKYCFHLYDHKKDRHIITYIYEKEFFTIENLKHIYHLLQNKKIWILRKIFSKRDFPNYLKPFGGSQWWALPIETIRFINEFIEKHKSYTDYHVYTHVPDEIFFHSIVGTYTDQFVIDKTITYVNWRRKNYALPLPVTFTFEDFNELFEMKKSHLFARKFDINLDSKILDRIDLELL